MDDARFTSAPSIAQASNEIANVPGEMKPYKHWVGYRLEKRPDRKKPSKVPYSPWLNGSKASVTNPTQWGTFEQATLLPITCSEAVEPSTPISKSGYSGVGFVLTKNDPFFVIDIDDAGGDQTILETQLKVYEGFQTYTEGSPSNTGCHIIGKANIASGRRRGEIEAYSDERYITMTGNVLRDLPIADVQRQADILYNELGSERGTKAGIHPDRPESLSDDAIVASLLRDPALAALYNGTSGGNPSEDDLSLVNAIAFRSRNRAQTERIWLASPLGQREKTHRRADYRQRTLDAAFNFPELPTLDLSAVNCKGEPVQFGVPQAAPKPSRAGIRASDLQHKQFAPVGWIVPGIITQGLTILGGRPKLGKSWLCLGVALAVAEGGYALGSFCQPGDVAYFALEDTQRRLQSRMWKVRGKEHWPSNLELFVELPRGAEGLAQVRCWLEENPTAKLILIDTLAKVRPANKNENRYDADYQAVADWKSLADEFDVGIVLVHHTRKQEADDPLEMISGTNGITGAADSIILLDRNGQGSFLRGRGRDLEEFAISIRLDENGLWQNLGDVDDALRSNERNSILNLLRQTGVPMSPKHIAHSLSVDENSTQQLLYKMVNKGELEKIGRGQYVLPPIPPHKIDKNSNKGLV
jgi:hypothetical protein